MSSEPTLVVALEGTPELAAAPSPVGKPPFLIDELFRSSTEVVAADKALRESHARLIDSCKRLLVAVRQSGGFYPSCEEEAKSAIARAEALQDRVCGFCGRPRNSGDSTCGGATCQAQWEAERAS